MIDDAYGAQATGCRPLPRSRSMSQTGPGSWSRKSHTEAPRRSTTMNLITDVLAGLVHFVGWLV
ncbi:hypothetical protein CP970_29960 [Streptomyces kanamyceticus]|uniref:Uncharacterized protein n=1 Tax=Streptomyces kanamyceticus TaxID=1967 RepID=A0A5J6GNF4_STRKN|nr:hypothetical protein CP970_29960 [Streptomyces kanamyceticus]